MVWWGAARPAGLVKRTVGLPPSLATYRSEHKPTPPADLSLSLDKTTPTQLVAGAFSSREEVSRAFGASLGMDLARVYASYQDMACVEQRIRHEDAGTHVQQVPSSFQMQTYLIDVA
jgi:hypothetical protein